MKKKQSGKLKRWLGGIALTLLILISLGLIFNQQIKNYLVDSYKPSVSQTSIKKIIKNKATLIFRVLSHWTFKV